MYMPKFTGYDHFNSGWSIIQLLLCISHNKDLSTIVKNIFSNGPIDFINQFRLTKTIKLIMRGVWILNKASSYLKPFQLLL